MFIQQSPVIFVIDRVDRITIALTIAGMALLPGAVLSIRHLQGLRKAKAQLS